MTYQYIDSPSNRSTVISSIVSFAVANAGFTAVDSSGDFQCISRSGLYWCLYPVSVSTSTYYQIAARLTSVKPTEATYLSVTGQYMKSGMGMHTYSGPYVGLHLFTNGIEVNCVLEIISGVFTHLNFGSITPFGSVVGHYVTGSVYSVADGYKYNPYNQSIQPYDGGLCSSVGRAAANFRSAMYYGGVFYAESILYNSVRVVWGGPGSVYNSHLFSMDYASYNYRRPLLRMYAVIKITGYRDKVVGVSEQARYVNLSRLQNKEIIEDDWMVFPYAQRTKLIGSYFDDSSASYGIAYKK